MAQDTAHARQRTERAHRCTRANWPRTPHTQHNTPSVHTAGQEPSGPGHCTCKTTHRAGTTLNRSQVAQDTAHTAQHTERAHWCTGAKWPRTPPTQHNAPSLHTGEQEPSAIKTPRTQDNAPSGHQGEKEPNGPGHRTHSTSHGPCAQVNRSQVAHETAQHNTPRGCTGA